MAKRQAQPTPRAIKLHPEQYERLKDKARIAQFVEAQAQQMVAAARAEVTAAMAKLGLDTSEGAAYDFDDAAHSVVKRPMPSAEVSQTKD
jgi:hypothetical protein